jgi:hypothetical protein
MRLVRRLCLTAAALVALTGGPRLAAAAPNGSATASGATRDALVAEQQRLRAELERVNAEIAALKRGERSVRTDYRLRERLADAEALARRLTELDARIGRNPAPDRPITAAEPRALPGDGPAELDAKADILSDQATRLAQRADAILGRARDLRARQSLRRHVGQLERDPFSPLEGSKRRAVATGTAFSTLAKGNGSTGSVGSSPGPASPSDTRGGAGQTPTTAQDSAGGVASAPQVSNGAPGAAPPPQTTMPPATVPGSTSVGATTPTMPAVTTPGAAVTTPRAPATPSLGADGAALSAQLRDLLDPTTLAEIQKLEATGGALDSFGALERAGNALKARAARLSQQAASLRAREHVTPGAR